MTDGLPSFFDHTWLNILFHQERSPLDWIILGIIVCFAVSFWVGGILLSRRPATYINVCRRFDLGLTAFFALLLFKLLLVYKGGIHVREPYSEVLIFSFFIFSFLAMGLVIQQHQPAKAFLSGFQGVGWILSFTLVTAGFAAAVILLFLPYLTQAAEATYAAVKTAAGPLSPVIISILRFLFAPRRLRQEPAATSSGAKEHQLSNLPADGGEMGFFQNLLTWSLAGLVGLLVMITLCLGIYYLLRWLWYKITQADPPERQPLFLRGGLARIWQSLCRLYQFFLNRLKATTTATRLFNAVVSWGRRSGLPRLAGETPLEYSQRLARTFPLLQQEIAVIVEAYHEEVYRESLLSGSHLKPARAAWHRLRSPRFWPNRLKTCLFGQRNPLVK